MGDASQSRETLTSLPWYYSPLKVHFASAPVSSLHFPVEIKRIGQARVWLYLVPSVAAFETLGSGEAKLSARQQRGNACGGSLVPASPHGRRGPPQSLRGRERVRQKLYLLGHQSHTA